MGRRYVSREHEILVLRQFGSGCCRTGFVSSPYPPPGSYRQRRGPAKFENVLKKKQDTSPKTRELVVDIALDLMDFLVPCHRLGRIKVRQVVLRGTAIISLLASLKKGLGALLRRRRFRGSKIGIS